MSRAPTAERPRVHEVAEGLYGMVLPLPYDPRTVNVFVEVGEDGGAILFDCGTDDRACRETLVASLREIGVGPERVTDVVLTHAHVDHYGLAGWMAAEHGSRIHLHRGETLILQRHWRPDWWIPEYAAYMVRHGVEPELAEELAALEDWRYTLHPLEGFLPIEHGDLIAGPRRRWRVVHTPGHSSGHVSLWDEESGLMVGGDHVLAVYSPHLRHVPGEMTDPLGSYLQSLDRVEDLAPDRILPGHGKPIEDLAAVAAELRAGHRRVLADVHAALGSPRSAREVTLGLHGDELPAFHLRLALPQVTVYLRHLEARGEARAHLEGGVIHYLATAADDRSGGRAPVSLEDSF